MATKMLDAIRKVVGAKPKLAELLAQRGREVQVQAAADVLGVELPSLDWHADPERAARWRRHEELVAASHAAREAVPGAQIAKTAAEKEHGRALDLADTKRERAAEEAFGKADREEKMLRARAERLELEGMAARKAAQEADLEAKVAERDRLLAAAKELTATRAARFAEDLVLARASVAIAERLDTLATDESSFGHLAGLGQSGREVLGAGASHVGGAHQLQTAFVDGDVVRMWVESAVRSGLLEE